MATFYNPPQFGTEYIFFVTLVDQADTKLMKVNPTIAAGDVQVDKDGANSFTNLNTIPAVVGSTMSLKITLSSAEMTAKNVTVVISDAVGAEWADLVINIQPSIVASSMTRGTIDSTTTPTTTIFECDDITEATTDHYKGKIMHFVRSVAGTDALVGQSTDITAYSLVGGKGRFTVTALTEAPSNNDEIVIV